MKDLDLLICVPHAGNGREWVERAAAGLKARGKIPKELLFRYQSHECDRWAAEVASALLSKLSERFPDKRIECDVAEIPRAWMDLNRPWERAVPPALESEPWKTSYLRECDRSESLHHRAKAAFHLHTMCGKNPLGNWTFTEQTDAVELEKFLSGWYSGADRTLDLLMETDQGRTVGDDRMAESVERAYRRLWHVVSKNGAYRLKEGYPATRFLDLSRGCLLEIPKTALSTDDTRHFVDSSRLVLDDAKIQAHAQILAEALEEWWKAQ